jgi:hypothetical protein
VVQVIETEFSDGTTKTWVHRQNDPPGDAIVLELDQNSIITGANDFSHFRLLARDLAKTTDDEKQVTFFVPGTAQLIPLEFNRQKQAAVSVLGETRNCDVWSVPEASMQFFVDSQTGELVQLDLTTQKTLITLNNKRVVKQAEKAQAEEVLAKHFAQTDVQFDNFLKVSKLTAKIDVNVIGSGIANSASVLQTSMQKFDGKKDNASIVGTVSIESKKYDGKRSPTLLENSSVAEEQQEWLKPAPFIESNHEPIIVRARELTKDSKTWWEATTNIGKWVENEIRYTIADTPSARLALEKKCGDCGPHSTLTVAMLRAVGIPAKLVGGVVYTPSFGGSFGQHAWVEVYMGEAGWISIDPTTGEFESMSATHIKLFEGMGGVVPTSVNVTSFEPPNKIIARTEPVVAKKINWPLQKPLYFKYTQAGTVLGFEKVNLEKIEHDGREAYQLTSDVELKVGEVSVKGPVKLVVEANGIPIVFHRKMVANGKDVIIDCTFEKGSVHENISGAQNLERDVKLNPGDFCFDNNFMGAWILICSQLELKKGSSIDVRTFHPSSMQVIPLTFEVSGQEKVTVLGKEVECFVCDIEPIKNKFWVTTDGRFVKAQQGTLVVELSEPGNIIH